jgi:asparagine synthase (glutamine-hydrolysing)
LQNFISKFYRFYPGIFGTGNNLLKYSKNYWVSYKSFLEDKKLLNLLGIKDVNINENLFLNKGLKKLKTLLLADYKFYLPEMMMFKVDRTAMANSLEVRSPFVDHLLIEYVMGHNLDYDPKNSKKILKDYLSEDFNSDFINRKKQGFIFDLEEFVYSNIKYIESLINNGDLQNYFKLNKIKYLKLRKSRINANRLWKLYVITLYLDNIKK